MATTFIYALCEPNSRTVRYIGKANNPLKRLGLHMSVSVKLNTHLGHWLTQLRNSGEKPNLVVLKEVPEDSWQEEETRFICSARVLGMSLVNGNDGGVGGHNPSLETRAKKRIASLGERNGMFGKSGPASPRFGSKNTPEQLRAMSRTGFRHSEETKAQMRWSSTGEKNGMFGKPSWARGFCFGVRQLLKNQPSFSEGGGI